MTLGLDLTDSLIRAVIVSGAGQVLARADQPIAAGGLAPALRAAVKQTRSTAGSDISTAGVATASPGEPPSQEIVSAAAERVRIVLSTLGSDAVAIGAARMAAQPPG